MGNIDSDDYHDFVIKDGKLIGEFEQMYQKSKDIPWHQNVQTDWLDVRLAIDILKEHGKFDNITDFGCGLGYFLNILSQNFAGTFCKSTGYDISETCCEIARQTFTNSNFHVLDLMAEANNKPQNGYNLFSIRGTLWYVFPQIETVVKNISNMAKTGDLLLISQNFPPLHSEFVGKQTIPNPEAIINIFSTFSPVKTIFLQDHNSNTNSNWFIGVFRR